MVLSRSSLVAIFAAVAATVAVMFYTTTLGQPTIVLDNEHLILDSRYHQEQFAISELALTQARIDDWNQKSPYWPERRISGNSSTKEGVFRLGNGDRAYVVNKGSGPLLYLPLSDNLVLAYRGDDAPDLLDRLRNIQSLPGI